MGTVSNIFNHKSKTKKISKHDEKYNSAKTALSKWTVVHEVGGYQFTLDELSNAIRSQKNLYDLPRCKQVCCRLWATDGDDCYLHGLLTRKKEKRMKLSFKG
jgi:hypothetical protein